MTARDAPAPPHRPYLALDAWRGVAALAVLAYHTSQVVAHDDPTLSSRPLYHLWDLGALGVQIFFVVSGYCIATSAASLLRRGQSPWRFLAARARRIYPPCWCALLLASAFYAAGALLVRLGYAHANVFTESSPLASGAPYLLSNFTLTAILAGQPLLLAVCWTLCYEVAFYVIVGAVLLAGVRDERRALSLLHMVTLAALVGLIVCPARVSYPFDLWPQFGLGLLVYDLLKNTARRAPKLWAGAVFALMGGFLLRHDLPLGYMQQPSRETFGVSLLFAVALLALSPLDGRLSAARPVRLLSAVGLFSYSLYLTHFITIRVVHQAAHLVRLPVGRPQSDLTVALLAAAFAIGSARCFYHFCERPFANSHGGKTAPGLRAGAAGQAPLPLAAAPHPEAAEGVCPAPLEQT